LKLADFTFVFGGLVQKRIARQKADFISKITVGTLTFLSKITNTFDNIDSIEGVLHVKDLFLFVLSKEKSFDLMQIIRSPYFLPESKRTYELFRELQKTFSDIIIALISQSYYLMSKSISRVLY
jgi:Mg2+/Co2+ transporter CorC